MNMNTKLSELYHKRFEGEHQLRNEMWTILCSSFFQKYISDNDIVLDLGAGYCEFINNIKCAEKYAVDLNEDVTTFADSNVRVFTCPSTEMTPFVDSSVDIVFTSNFLEHLRAKEDVLKTLSEVHRILKIGGRVLILQPNIRYAYREYWDFFDHHIPLSDKSLIEVLILEGFRVEQVLPRFLPYTTKSKFPRNSFFIKTYLKLPFLWKLFGKQLFIVAGKK